MKWGCFGSIIFIYYGFVLIVLVETGSVFFAVLGGLPFLIFLCWWIPRLLKVDIKSFLVIIFCFFLITISYPLYKTITDLITAFPIIIPLFWLLARQVVIFLTQFLVLRFGFPPHRAKQIDRALGNLFGFLVIAVIWEWPGTLNLGLVNDLWTRISLTIITLVFLLFTYLTQDLLPKRRLIRGLGSQDDDLRQQTVKSLNQMRSGHLTDINPKIKLRLVDTLRRMGSGAVPALIQLLRDDNDLVRRHVVEALGSIGPVTTAEVPVLIQLLGDDNSDVRNHTSNTLKQIGPATTAEVPSLIELLEDKNNIVRLNAVEALTLVEIGPDEVKLVIPALIQLLEDKNSIVRLNVVEALTLVEIGPDEMKLVIPALIQLSEDKNNIVRSATTSALAEIEKTTEKKNE